MKKNRNTTIKSILKDIKNLVMVVKYYGLNPEPVKWKSKEKYVSLSPFKEETNPSFKIYPRGEYRAVYGYCYATKTRANAIDIIRAKENCSLNDAYNKFREILGIPQPSTYTTGLNFKFATRLLRIIQGDRNDSKPNDSNPFDKNMFNIFAGVYNQYKQLYGKLEEEAQKSIKNNMLKASIDRYIQKELDIPLIDFYGVILWAENVGIIEELTPDLKAEAELVVNGEISNPTEPLKVNTDETVELAKKCVQQKADITNPISYSFQMLGGIRILEGQYEQLKLSTPYIPEWKSDTGGEKLEQKFFDHATKIQFAPFIYSTAKLIANTKNSIVCRKEREGFIYNRLNTNEKELIIQNPTCSLGISAFQLTHHTNTWRTTSNSTLDSLLIGKPNIESSDVLLSTSSSAIVKEKNLERKTSIPYTNTQEKSVDFSKCPETIDGYSKNMLNYLKLKGISEEKLIEYGVKQTSYGGLLFSWDGGKVWRVYNPLNAKNKKNRCLKGARMSEVVFGWEKQERLIEEGKNREMCIVTKSPIDALALSEMEFDTIAPMSESYPLPKEVMDKLLYEYTKIIFLYDNDNTGRGEANKRVEELLDRKPSGKETKVISIFFPKDGKGKDVSERVSDMVYAGIKIEDAVKTVKNEIEQLIANEIVVKKGAELVIQKEQIRNTTDTIQEQITKKDRIIKSPSKGSRLISSINDECTQEYSKEFLDGLCISKEDLKQLDIWEHKKTKCAILILDVLQTFDTNKRKHDISYVYHAYNWQYTNSKISDSPGAKDYLFLMNFLHKKFPGSDELMADKPLVIASSPEDARTIYSNRTDYYVVGVIDKDFHFGEEQRHYMCYITNKFSSVTVLDMPSLAEELNNFAKEERIMPFKASIDTFEEFMKLENEELAKELS
jgi:DNA primase